MTNFLYWLYLWQLKEYRADRMKLHFQSVPREEWLRLWLVGLRRRPRITVKVLVIAALTALISLLAIVFFMSIYIPWPLAVIFTYGLVPLFVSLSVGMLVFPSQIVTDLLISIAALKRRRFKDLVVIGVTGSYGKTSTKEAIASVLGEKFKVLKTRGGVNTKLGIAKQIIKELNNSYEFYVVEMGAYKKGEIEEICSFVDPKIGVLTGVNEQHLGLFGSLENTIEAKFELIDHISRQGGYAFLNTADPNVKTNLARVKCEYEEYSSTNPSENVNGAVKVGKYFGLTDEEISRGLSKVKMPKGRLEVKTLDNGMTLLDDSYSSNPAGFRSAVEKLLSLGKTNNVVIFTGVYDLGVKSEEINKSLNDYLKDKSNHIYLVEPLFEPFYKDAQLVESSKELINIISEMSPKEAAILLEGRNRVINKLKKGLLGAKKEEKKVE